MLGYHHSLSYYCSIHALALKSYYAIMVMALLDFDFSLWYFKSQTSLLSWEREKGGAKTSTFVYVLIWTNAYISFSSGISQGIIMQIAF